MVWEGDDLPVSALPADGTFPSGTAKWEKRNVATEIPVWNEWGCLRSVWEMCDGLSPQ